MYLKNLSVPVMAAISVVSVTTGVLGVFGVIHYNAEKRRDWADLNEKLAMTTEQLAAGLAPAVWDIDRQQISRIVESAMREPQVHEVKVQAADEIYVKTKEKSVSNTLVEVRPIFFSGEQVGKVQVAFTPQIVLDALEEIRTQYILLILLVDLTLALSLYLVLWKTVLRPLREVERYAVSVSSGLAPRERANSTVFHAELETLRSSIEKMVQLLESRIEQIRDSEQRYRTLFSAEPDTLLIVDQISARILDANEAAAAMYGYSHEQLLKMSFLELSVDQEEARKKLRSLKPFDEQGTSIMVRRRHRKRDGSSFAVDVSARAFRLQERVALVLAIRDISERIRSEADLYRAKERAESADKVKSEFLDIAAHELKTPLTPLTLLVQLARNQVRAGETISNEIWERMSLQVERLTALIHDLLDVSRLERGTFPVNRTRVELNQLISRCVQDFRDQAKDREIIFDGTSEPTEMSVDPIRIYEVVANLIDNAMKYTPEHSPIETRLMKLPDGKVRVAVTDHGRGISPDQKRALFSRFFRVSSEETRRHSGLGLGLYICRRIIELHQGTIAVQSEPGKGSTFYFDLPKNADEKKAA